MGLVFPTFLLIKFLVQINGWGFSCSNLALENWLFRVKMTIWIAKKVHLNVKIWVFVPMFATIKTIIFISFPLLYAQLPFLVLTRILHNTACKTRLKSLSVSKAAKLMKKRLTTMSRGWIFNFGNQKMIFAETTEYGSMMTRSQPKSIYQFQIGNSVTCMKILAFWKKSWVIQNHGQIVLPKLP